MESKNSLKSLGISGSFLSYSQGRGRLPPNALCRAKIKPFLRKATNDSVPIFDTICFSWKVQVVQGLEQTQSRGQRAHAAGLGKSVFFVADPAMKTGLDSAKAAFLRVINDRPRSRPDDSHPHPRRAAPRRSRPWLRPRRAASAPETAQSRSQELRPIDSGRSGVEIRVKCDPSTA